MASEAKHVETIRRLHFTLVKELGEDPEETEKRCRADLARGYDLGGKEKKPKGKKGERRR